MTFDEERNREKESTEPKNKHKLEIIELDSQSH